MTVRLALLFILLAFRFYDLGVRPPHHDEAVNGWFVDGMFKKGFYQYDPQNYHGPLFFYILGLFRMIFGRSLEALRAPIVLFSWVVTFTPFLFKKWIGERAAWIATFFLAVSPAMIFYSRYTIHEMEFMLASILFFYYWILTRNEGFNRKNILGLGISLGSMACLKENFVMYLACLGLAEFMARVYEKHFVPAPLPLKGKTAKTVKLEEPLAKNTSRQLWVGLASVTGIALVLIIIFFSAFFKDANGVPNFFKAFYLWSQTGSNGNGHQKPFFYWIKVFFQYEWFALLGLLLAPLALQKVPRELRLVSVLSVGMWFAYSIVAYKTPWCLMSFYWGLILIAAYWVSRWMENQNWKPVAYVILLIGFGFSFYTGYVTAYDKVDEDNQYYIYGQTYRDVMVPLHEMLDDAKKNPVLLEKERIVVVSAYTWPLPYVLGEFKQVAYYGESNAAPKLDGDYILIDEFLEKKFVDRIDLTQYDRKVYRARQWASPMVFYRKHPAK